VRNGNGDAARLLLRRIVDAESKGRNCANPFNDKTLVIAAVSVVLP
jgi:hypothetical protein